MPLPVLAITGAAGRIGTAMRPLLRERYHLRLIDRHPISDAVDGETALAVDVSDFAAAEPALAGADLVLHLAGDASTSASWPEVRRANVDGTFNVFESARRAGARKVVFASTNHVRGFDYLEGKFPVDDSGPIRPDSLYGVSKAFGEALARYYADAFDMSMICIRIGWFTPHAPNIPDLNPLWISARDLAHLFTLALESPRRFGIYNGESLNPGYAQWDLATTIAELGYAPQDDVQAHEPAGAPDARAYVEPQTGVLRS